MIYCITGIVYLKGILNQSHLSMECQDSAGICKFFFNFSIFFFSLNGDWMRIGNVNALKRQLWIFPLNEKGKTLLHLKNSSHIFDKNVSHFLGDLKVFPLKEIYHKTTEKNRYFLSVTHSHIFIPLERNSPKVFKRTKSN